MIKKRTINKNNVRWMSSCCAYLMYQCLVKRHVFLTAHLRSSSALIRSVLKGFCLRSPVSLYWHRIFFVGTVSVLAGCVQTTEHKTQSTPAENMIEKVAELSTEKSAVPRVITDALLSAPAREAALKTPEKTIERFDVTVENIPAKSFFLSLVSGSKVNIVVHPEVSGTISLDLKNVAIDEVLRVIRDIYGYEYQYADNIYTIYPRKLRTQVFPINYLDVQRVGISDTSVLVGKIASESNGDQNRSAGNQNDNVNLLGVLPGRHKSSQGNSNQPSSLTPGSRVQTLTKTDFWTSLQETVLAIIGGNEGEKMVMVNAQSGMVVVKALPHELQAVRLFLERSELSVKRQVILETKILEVTLNDGFEAGINWSSIGGQILLGNNVADFESPANILSASESVGEVFSSLIRVGDISELLALLKTQGNVQVLSSPRVATVNNQKAIIRVGSDEFFVTGISSETTSTASSTISNPNIELSSFFSGIALDVTPQIAENGDVILHIHPVISNVKDQLKDLTVGDEQFSLPLALRDIRESDSIVRAKNGQVVVLGGLMQESVTEVKGKRPFIGDIPVVNSLFRTKNESREKTELVILMRPIVVNDAVWNDQISTTKERIRVLGDEYRSTR